MTIGLSRYELRRPRYEGGLPRRGGGAIDYREDFFGKPAFLTVSGQLQVHLFTVQNGCI